MFDNVIVGIDESEAGRDAIALANELASREHEWQLALAYVEVVMAKPTPGFVPVWEAADVRRAAERLASLADELDLGAEVLCIEARSVAAGLHNLAAGRDADLLVVGASRRDAYERVFVGDDAREVLDDPPCAVAVAPRGYATGPPAMKRIGVAFDRSAQSDRALATARQLTREHGGERVEPDAAVAGDAAEALASFAASVDLLLVGSRERRLLDWLRPGSTAQRLAERATCPLLVVSDAPDHKK
jgi:nucleotide-binding universal stress UspA family protein